MRVQRIRLDNEHDLSFELLLSDLQYGRKRLVIRYRTGHPKRARTKSRTERVVASWLPALVRY